MSTAAKVARLIADGRCTSCCNRLDASSLGVHRTCAACRQRWADAVKDRVSSNGCRHCGKPATPGKSTCERCRARDADRRRMERGTETAKTKRCSVCGLLEPHGCLDSYSSLATSRPGPREAGLYTMKHPRGQ